MATSCIVCNKIASGLIENKFCSTRCRRKYYEEIANEKIREQKQRKWNRHLN